MSDAGKANLQKWALWGFGAIFMLLFGGLFSRTLPLLASSIDETKKYMVEEHKDIRKEFKIEDIHMNEKVHKISESAVRMETNQMHIMSTLKRMEKKL